MMRIKQLRLKNFKLFDNHHIDFKPLTLLTGPNSAGKSSILGALTTVLQTRSPHLFPFEIVPNGSNISLGGYRDIATKHKTNANIGIGLTLQDGKDEIEIQGEYRYASRGNQTLLNKLSFKSPENTLDVDWGGEQLGYQAKYSSKTDNELLKAVTKMMGSIAKQINPKSPTSNKLPDDFMAFADGNVRSSQIVARKAFEILDELEKNIGANFSIQDLRRNLSTFLSNTDYIGPIRSFPSRHYSPEDGRSKLDPFGENACATLADWKVHFQDRYKLTLKLLTLLQVASNVDTKILKDSIRIEVQPFNHSEKVNFVDVGFGVSQVLPIIVSDIALKKGGTLLINQPEVHLHPSSQASFGNYFAERLADRNYIVETHSEYLITRLRLLVAEGKLKTENINIVFIDSEKNQGKSPKIFNISITKDGAFKNAPDNFFKTYYDDSFKLAMAGL